MLNFNSQVFSACTSYFILHAASPSTLDGQIGYLHTITSGARLRSKYLLSAWLSSTRSQRSECADVHWTAVRSKIASKCDFGNGWSKNANYSLRPLWVRATSDHFLHSISSSIFLRQLPPRSLPLRGDLLARSICRNPTGLHPYLRRSPSHHSHGKCRLSQPLPVR